MEIDENKMQLILLQILHEERKNLRNHALSDVKMADEIGKIICTAIKERY